MKDVIKEFLHRNNIDLTNQTITIGISTGVDSTVLLHIVRSIYPKDILEIQRCVSFGKNESSEKIFKCDAGVNSVVMTPDLQIYPCLFFAKPGNEIGYYHDGQIYISDNYENDERQCRALLKLNKKR